MPAEERLRKLRLFKSDFAMVSGFMVVEGEIQGILR
jgi:hypothetical protein